MSLIFFGHANILSEHKNTLEFTKDSNLTLNGDCIIGVKADYDLLKLKKFIRENIGKKIKAKIAVEGTIDEIGFELNEHFIDGHEMVIRKTSFLCKRTLGIKADKAAVDIKREIIAKLKKS